MFDKFRDECGVFGIFGHPEAANMTYLGLYALQHRGQESAGIAASDGVQVRIARQMGYVADVFDSATLSHLPGSLAIGHVRYSTAGESKLANAAFTEKAPREGVEAEEAKRDQYLAELQALGG